ncbi:RNA-binding protein [Flavobacterium psychrophilum]|nr:RNA-binding protein [Flavobacterium psychrophilum]AOE53686.1 RNA-binding protein [Flavobacterium psychrophilum]
MAKRFNEEQPIGDVLKQFMQANRLQEGMDKLDVREAWKNLMGNGVNNYTREIMLRNNTLYVELTSSVLREELTLGKAKIIAMINDELKREVVKNIVLR